MSYRVFSLPWKPSMLWLFIPLYRLFNTLYQVKEVSFYSFDNFLRIEIKSGIGTIFVMLTYFFLKNIYLAVVGRDDLYKSIGKYVNYAQFFCIFCFLFSFSIFHSLWVLKFFLTVHQFFALRFEAYWIAYFIIMKDIFGC